jgi:hypothetical protein
LVTGGGGCSLLFFFRINIFILSGYVDIKNYGHYQCYLFAFLINDVFIFVLQNFIVKPFLALYVFYSGFYIFFWKFIF